MRVILAASILLIPASALAQSSTAVGVGIARSDAAAISSSRATAISGQGGTGIGVGTGGNSSVTIAGTPAVSTQNLVTSGTSTVRNVPAVFAPGLSAAGLETCLGSVSGGGSIVGTGLTFGTSIPDPGCAARLDARTLWSMGLKKAAVARLCLNPDINRSMPDVCGTYLPQPVIYPAAYPVAAPAPLPPFFPGLFASTATPESVRDGGAIMLIDGSTGKERLCNIYAHGQQKCLAWADAKGATKRLAARKHSPAVMPVKLRADPPPVNAPKAAEAVTVVP